MPNRCRSDCDRPITIRLQAVSQSGRAWESFCCDDPDHYASSRNMIDALGFRFVGEEPYPRVKCMILGCDRDAQGDIDRFETWDGIVVPAHFCRYCVDHPCEMEVYLLRRKRR